MQTPIRDSSGDMENRPTESMEAIRLPEGFVFEPLGRWAAETPDKVAVLGTSAEYTYAQTEAVTNQIARALRARGARPGGLVALVLPRGVEAVLTLVGVLKSGAAYVPLDADTPAERITHCLEDSNPSWVIVQEEELVDATATEAQLLTVEELFAEAEKQPSDALPLSEVGVVATDLAYVIFTSGTTGRPKGVPISHAALTNFVVGDQEVCIKVLPGDRVLQGFSPSSDGHHEEVWPTFLAGATLVVASTEHIHSGPELHEFLVSRKVTIVSCAPTLLSMVEKDVPSLRRILFGAERCPAELVRRWWRPNREIINTYGPTEATVGTTYGYCVPDEPITIGVPLPNYHCYILDEQGDPVSQGVEGELCIAGVGVSAGYLGKPELNAEKFVPNPFRHEGGHDDMLYRTGDRVRLNEAGNIEWLGRIDAQVKIRGHRIELTEVEARLIEYPSVQTAVVVARADDTGEVSLSALFVERVGESFEASEVLALMHESLPAYMVPRTFEKVDAIPRLPSGKVDRRACERLHGVTVRIEREILPPHTDAEKLVLQVWQGLFPGADISVADDFFRDLGGYSLLASRFISLLRNDHGYPRVSVLDIYQNPTIRSFAAVLESHVKHTHAAEEFHKIPKLRFLIARVVQAAAILFLFTLQGVFWLGPLFVMIALTDRDVLDFHALLIGFGLHAISVPIMLGFTAAAKWAIIGRFKPGRYPLWGGYFLRWWFVHRLLGVTPVGYLTGTPLSAWYLRMLGAKVGKNVNLESVEIDCPDQIDIGNDCTFENSSWIHAAEVVKGELIIRPVKVGNGCSIGVRAGICGGAVLEDGCSLRDMTCAATGLTIPAGEEWEGSPASKCDKPSLPPYDPAKQPSKRRLTAFAFLQAFAVTMLCLFDSVPFLSVTWVLYSNSYDWGYVIWEPVSALVLVTFACIQALIVKWAVLGRLKAGTHAFPGFYYVRKWFAERHLEAVSGSIVPVYDSLFARPWCQALGMKCGPRCEIAIPRRMPYDLVQMGEESFLASEVSIGRPVRRNGQLILEPTKIGKRAFLGNDSVVPQGLSVPDEFLLGVLSVCPDNKQMGSSLNQAWLGSPAFQMPSREVHDQFDVQQTYRPTRKLYVQRLIHESIRVFLPSLCSLIIAIAIIESFAHIWMESLPLAILAFPLLYSAGTFLAACMCLIAKWILIGKYKPTIQPLWSQYVWKTETYSAILHDFAAPLFMSDLMGTPFMGGLMKFLGARVGKRCYINTTDFTETDLIHLGDDVAINSNAPLQAHLFEDRVTKVGPIKIGDRCTVGNYSVVLCESELRHDAHVGHLSLVMKGETIPSGTNWAGSPAQAVPDAAPDPLCKT